jgi:hypothetical protein
LGKHLFCLLNDESLITNCSVPEQTASKHIEPQLWPAPILQCEHHIFLFIETLPHLLPHGQPQTQLFNCQADVEHSNLRWDAIPNACVQGPQDYLHTIEPRLETRQSFFLVGFLEGRGRELESRKRVRGWETSTMWLVFRKLLGWIFESSSCFFKMHLL